MSNTLPPLPEPTLEAHEYEIWGQNVKGDFYTAEQMQAYATAALQAQGVPVVPANCRQRLKSEGKAYAKSNCTACGELSPKWKECDALLASTTSAPQQIGQVVPDSVLNALDNFEKKERSPFQTYLVTGLVTGLVDELRTALLASVQPAPQIKPCPLCKSQHGPQICCTTVDIALTTQAVPAPQQKSQSPETNKEPVVEGFVKRACPYCESVWYGQKDDYPHVQAKSQSDEHEIAACGLMPLIEDYAIAVRNGDKNSSTVLKKTIEASLEELESQWHQKE